MSLFWIPYLRRLSKSVTRNCYGCKKFRRLPYHSPKSGPLPKDRTEKYFPFEVIGTDYAGTIYFKTKKKSELKAYILLFSCSVTRALHIELGSNITTAEFIKSFKRLMSWRGKPKIFYSDNAKTFKAGAKWLANISKDQKLHDFLNSYKETLWKRWKHEYLVALREKHNLKHKDKTIKINVDDVVMIKGEEKNRGHWKKAIVNHL